MISDHACKTHAFIVGIDTCAGKGEFKSLRGAIGIESFEELLQGDIDGQCAEVSAGSSALCDPNLENNLHVTHMELIQKRNSMTIQSMFVVAVSEMFCYKGQVK